MRRTLALGIVTLALWLAPAPAPAQDACNDAIVGVTNFLNKYEDRIPPSDLSACLAECKAIAKGCEQVAKAALKCQGTEGKAEDKIAQTNCKVDEDPKGCKDAVKQGANARKADLADQATTTSGTCSAFFDDCELLDCGT